MASNTSFGYTNTEKSGANLALVDLGITTNYSLMADEPSYVTYSNNTAPLTSPETVSYRFEKINKVNTSNTILYPQKVSSGVRYGTRNDSVLTTTFTGDSCCTENLVQNPVVVTISVSHDVSPYVTDAFVKDAFERAVSDWYDKNGNFRGGQLMRGAIRITQ